MWDYPRPPRLERSHETVDIHLGGRRVARSSATYRVLETSHPPTYYVPIDAFEPGVLVPSDGSSFCEWKGQARYFDMVTDGATVPQGAWTYPNPTQQFVPLIDHVALYPAKMDQCLVDGEVVRPQAGGFYGGWITDRVVGPFKGEPGTWGW